MFRIARVDYGTGFDVCIVSSDTDIGRSLRDGRDYERNIADLLDRNTPRNCAFADFGAHWGIFSVYMALRGADPVYAFEPDLINYYALERTIRINDLRGVIRPFPFAAWDRLEMRQLVIDPENTGNHKIEVEGDPPHTERIHRTVLAVPANELIIPCRESDALYAKFDCQGSEIRALRGCAGLNLKAAIVERCFHEDEEIQALFESSEIHGDQMVCRNFGYPQISVGGT